MEFNRSMNENKYRNKLVNDFMQITTKICSKLNILWQEILVNNKFM